MFTGTSLGNYYMVNKFTNGDLVFLKSSENNVLNCEAYEYNSIPYVYSII